MTNTSTSTKYSSVFDSQDPNLTCTEKFDGHTLLFLFQVISEFTATPPGAPILETTEQNGFMVYQNIPDKFYSYSELLERIKEEYPTFCCSLKHDVSGFKLIHDVLKPEHVILWATTPDPSGIYTVGVYPMKSITGKCIITDTDCDAITNVPSPTMSLPGEAGRIARSLMERISEDSNCYNNTYHPILFDNYHVVYDVTESYMGDRKSLANAIRRSLTCLKYVTADVYDRVIHLRNHKGIIFASIFILRDTWISVNFNYRRGTVSFNDPNPLPDPEPKSNSDTYYAFNDMINAAYAEDKSREPKVPSR